MVTRAGFLTTRFGGYLHREVLEEDAELSHVDPNTPCGEYLRRFWQPICFSDELKDLPHRVKILGEELVVFRDLSGAVGLLELHCPHRGASLEFGLIDAKGIRCCYHGWLFAADGTILETPGEPAHSTLKDRLYHGAPIPPMSTAASSLPIWVRSTGSRLFRCMTALCGQAIG
jgi:nitrite reductase/ring-hydroxylating ferredoxin subunit